MAVAEPAAWQTSLKNYHHKLRTGLLIDITLPAFRQLLTAEEYSQVESQKSDVTRVDELVKILLTKDALTFERFCFALEKNGYPGWAGKLRRKDADRPSVASSGMHHGSPPSADTDYNPKAFWTFIVKLVKEMRGECAVFGVLVVGETGSGKSTLINSLVGQAAVKEGHSLVSETSTVAKCEMVVEGVPVTLYDTPGLGDSRGVQDDAYLQKMEGILKSGEIHLVIYCLKLSETRMRDSLVRTFQAYNKIGVKWERSIIALTFADYVPVPGAVRKQPGFEMDHFFNARVAEMHSTITRKLVERAKVMPEVASEIKCNPSTSDTEEALPNGEYWYIPFWLDILELLSPGAAIRFLEMRANNMQDMHFSPKEGERFQSIFAEKMRAKAKTGAKAGAITGAVVGAVGGPLGVLLGAGAGAAIGTALGANLAFMTELFSWIKKK